MTRIVWDQISEHIYETGVDHGVLYPIDSTGHYPAGVPWNGLTTVSQSPSGADSNDLYADNIKYLSLRAAEDFGATIEAYTYPDEWAQCDGSAEIVQGVTAGQQTRKAFGLSYRTLIGNDTMGTAYGYKIHLIYNATASPSERSYATVNDSPDAIQFSWEVTTIPVNVGGNFKPTAHLEIDSTKADANKLKVLEAILYGTDAGDEVQPPEGVTAGPRLPLPDEVITLLTPGN